MTARNPVSLALALAALLAIATPAARAAEAQTVSAQIDVRPYKLDTEAGRTALRLRILQVARDVCGTADYNDFTTVIDMKHCREAATFAALSQMDIAVAAARTNRSANAEVALSNPSR